MDPIFRKSSRFLAVAGAALAMTFGAAYAADAADDGMPTSSTHAQSEPGGHNGGAAFMRRLEALHAQLKLSPEQEKNWQSAVTTMKQNHQTMRASHQQMREQLKTLQQPSILDLDALHAAHQRVEQQNQQLREQTMTTWLTFYDSLDNQQKTIVSTAIKKRFAQMEARHKKMHDQWKQHDGASSNS
jgi:Spy/CpxP family protein refolding chaperone